MQKHQQWLNNRIYEQHLHCLTKIKQNNSRKNQVKSATHCRRRKVSHNHQDSPTHAHMQNEDDNYNTNSSWGKTHKQMKFTAKQKQLVWNNFLLGKRIIETNPVINAKKQQNQYQKYKKILDRRIEQTKKLAINTDFRNNSTYFQQFRIKVVYAQYFQAQQYAENLNDGSIQVDPMFENTQYLDLSALSWARRYTGEDENLGEEICAKFRNCQCSFVFKYFAQKGTQSQRNSLLIDIYEVKGLEERHIGGFSIDRQNICSDRICTEGELRKNAKEIGHVSYQIFILNRRKLKQTS